jgi:hypothetical protein
MSWLTLQLNNNFWKNLNRTCAVKYRITYSLIYEHKRFKTFHFYPYQNGLSFTFLITNVFRQSRTRGLHYKGTSRPVCVCVCVCVSNVKFSHLQRPINSSNKAVVMWNIQNTKEKWCTYNTPHSTESYPAVNDSCYGVTFTRINSPRTLDTHFNIRREVANSFGRGITSRQWIMPNEISTASMLMW